MAEASLAGDASGGVGRAGGLPSPLTALEFLTVVRLRRAPLLDGSALAAAQLWYPCVGALIGGVLALLDLALRGRLPPAPEGALLLVAWEGVTGLLHLDGLADCADGLLGLHGRERRLEIMRDSRLGSFGVAAVVLYLLLANAALGSLHGNERTATLIAAPALGRGAMVGLAGALPYARSDGLGLGFRRAARRWPGGFALLSAAVIAVLCAGAGGLVLACAAAAGSACVALLAWRRLGGVTGDVFGAGCELAQAGVLLAAAAMQGAAWFRPWL
ncbi:MAG TPA: adenosylcobinamide-GDP ribazoletransferase [Dehalococcoidia bacterium]|nr:adenosylcobinamide-GDP ribazoletransferase [Dehalococcoidia bacterium]